MRQRKQEYRNPLIKCPDINIKSMVEDKSIPDTLYGNFNSFSKRNSYKKGVPRNILFYKDGLIDHPLQMELDFADGLLDIYPSCEK